MLQCIGVVHEEDSVGIWKGRVYGFLLDLGFHASQLSSSSVSVNHIGKSRTTQSKFISFREEPVRYKAAVFRVGWCSTEPV